MNEQEFEFWINNPNWSKQQKCYDMTDSERMAALLYLEKVVNLEEKLKETTKD